MDSREPEVMKMLRRIREEIHEDTSGLSDDDWVKKIKAEAEECKKEFGLKLPKRVRIKG